MLSQGRQVDACNPSNVLSRLIGRSGPGLLGSSFRASTCHHRNRSCRPGSSATPFTTGKPLRKTSTRCLASCSMLSVWKAPQRKCSREWDPAASTYEGDQLFSLHCRTNYALIIVAALGVALLRNPGALMACGVCFSAALCLNDTFATTLRCCEVLPQWTCCIAHSCAT